MWLIATATGGEEKRELLEPGKYDAVCVWVIDLWSQQIIWNEVAKMQHKVQILFELCGKTYEREGQTYPMIRSKKYTLSMYEQGNLRKDLKLRFGKDQWESFDISSLLGKKAELTIIHETSKKTGTEYETIWAIWMSNHIKEPSSLLIEYYIDTHNDEVFENLWKRTKEMIENSPEYKKMKQKKQEDLLPF